MLTPGEVDRLPFCEFSVSVKCKTTNKVRTEKHCVTCQLVHLLSALRADNQAEATEAAMMLQTILKKYGRLET